MPLIQKLVFRGATKTLLEVSGTNDVAKVKKLVLAEGEKIVAVMVATADGENPTNIQFLIGQMNAMTVQE